MLSISLTFPNHAATQNTVGLLISSTASKVSCSTICKQIKQMPNLEHMINYYTKQKLIHLITNQEKGQGD